MKRSKRQNKNLRERNNKVKSLYNKQRNFCVSSLRNNKKDYFGNSSSKTVTDNRKFWKTISPLFSKKAFHRQYIKESKKRK